MWGWGPYRRWQPPIPYWETLSSARVKRWLPLVSLVVVAVAFSWSHWSAEPRWTPDGLFYEAQARELTGTPAATARHDVFSGPLANFRSAPSRHVDRVAWVEYAAPFFRRRWVVPVLATALRPAVGDRALQIVSLLGYVLSGLVVYLLARRRFSVGISFAVGLVALWFPPLRIWAAHPLTDTMGVVALGLALTAGMWSLHGKRTRLVVWALSVLVLSFTRDTAVIAFGAALWLVLAKRSRRTAALAVTAAAAAAPAMLLFGAPLRQTMAFTFSDNQIPTDTSWHFVVHRYGAYLHTMINYDFPFLSTPIVTLLLLGLVALLTLRPGPSPALWDIRRWTIRITVCFLAFGALLIAPLQLATFSDPVPPGMLLIAALLPLFVPAGGDDLLCFVRGGSLCAVGYLCLLPQWTELRLSLVVLPFAAIGLARGIELGRMTREPMGTDPRGRTTSVRAVDLVNY